MIALDENALICDFAETYHILDYKALDVVLASTLAAGLRDDSRIKQVMYGLPSTMDIVLDALTVDNLTTLAWFQTEDGAKGRNRPSSIFEALKPKKKEDDVVTFASMEDFKKARKKLLMEARNANSR